MARFQAHDRLAGGQRIETLGFLAAQGHYRRFRSAEAWLAGGSLTVLAVGPKCSLSLVRLPLDPASHSGLPGKEAVITCDSFLVPVDSYGSCRLGGGRGVDYYFPIVGVRCLRYDEPDQTLVVEFAGRLLETHWRRADMGGASLVGLPVSGLLRCRARWGEAPNADS